MTPSTFCPSMSSVFLFRLAPLTRQDILQMFNRYEASPPSATEALKVMSHRLGSCPLIQVA